MLITSDFAALQQTMFIGNKCGLQVVIQESTSQKRQTSEHFVPPSSWVPPEAITGYNLDTICLCEDPIVSKTMQTGKISAINFQK